MHKSAHSPSFNATFLTPVKLCKCLLICYYVQNENLKSKNSSTRDLLYKLGIYLVNQIQDNTECENEYTWEDIENQISESFKEYSSTITTWLISKVLLFPSQYLAYLLTKIQVAANYIAG